MTSRAVIKPNISIVKTVYNDIPEIRTLQAKIWNDTYPNESAGIEKKWIERITKSWLTPKELEGSNKFMGPKLVSPSHFHRVAKVKGVIRGFLHASKADEKQHLEAIYVDSEYQGSGIAQELMSHAMGWFDKHKDITLEVADYNDRAIAFYKKYGFGIEKDSKHVFADRIPTVNMIRKGDKK